MLSRAVGALFAVTLFAGFLCAGEYSGVVYRYESDTGTVTLLIPKGDVKMKEIAKIDKDSRHGSAFMETR